MSLFILEHCVCLCVHVGVVPTVYSCQGVGTYTSAIKDIVWGDHAWSSTVRCLRIKTRLEYIDPCILGLF